MDILQNAFVIVAMLVYGFIFIWALAQIPMYLFDIYKKIAKVLLHKYGIIDAPGSKLLSLVDFFFSPKTVEQTFKPLVADWRYEYFEAFKQGRKGKAQWVSMRYRCTFVWAMSLSKVLSLLKQLKSVSK